METNIQFDGFEIAVIITGVILFFYIYYYIAHSAKVERFLFKIYHEESADTALFLFRKLTGFFVLGIVPGILYFGFMDASREKFGITFRHLESSILLIASLIVVTAVVLFFHHRGNPQRSTLQLKPAEWSTFMLMLNIFGWAVYLIAYEFLFRGVLLLECYEAFGFWPAVAVNVALYSAIHMVSGKDQTIGALIFGTIACYFTLTRGTLLIPVFMHLSLSILSDLYSIRVRHKMKPAVRDPLNSENI